MGMSNNLERPAQSRRGGTLVVARVPARVVPDGFYSYVILMKDKDVGAS